MSNDNSGNGPSIAAVRTSLERKTERIEELEAALKDEESRVAHQRQRIDRLEAELMNKERRIQQLETENDQLRTRVDDIETTLDGGKSAGSTED
jgi:chromosome segregation ATPase